MSEHDIATAHATRYHIGNPPVAMKTTLRGFRKRGDVPHFSDNSSLKTWIKSNGGKELASDRGKADDATRAYMNLGVALELEDGRILIDLQRLEQLIDHIHGNGSWSHHSHKSAAKRARKLLKDLEDRMKSPKTAASVKEEQVKPVSVSTAAGKVEVTSQPVVNPSDSDPMEIFSALKSRQEAAAEHARALAAARTEFATWERRLQEASDAERQAEENLRDVSRETDQAEGLRTRLASYCEASGELVARLERELLAARKHAAERDGELKEARDLAARLVAARHAAIRQLEGAQREGEETLVVCEAAHRKLQTLLSQEPKDTQKLERATDLLEQLRNLLSE